MKQFIVGLLMALVFAVPAQAHSGGCGDGVDNDRDGQTDELCQSGSGSTQNATPKQSSEPSGGSGGAPNGHLASIAKCESGGDPTAISPGGKYRGKYQFSRETWASVGGSGDPAQASEAEQDRRAAKLYATAGAGQWPVCGS